MKSSSNRRLDCLPEHRLGRSSISSAHVAAFARSCSVIGVLCALAVGVASCSSPSATARACSAKAGMETSLSDLRGFDFTNPNAAKMATILDALAGELKAAEAAVPLPQNARLRALGGVSHLRQLRGNLLQSSQALHNAHRDQQPIVVFQLRSTVRTQGAQVQNVADAISGC